MFTFILIAGALFIGWATPQPAFAKVVTDWFMGKLRALKAKIDDSDSAA